MEEGEEKSKEKVNRNHFSSLFEKDFGRKMRIILKKQRCDIPQGVLFFIVVYLVYILVSLRSFKGGDILPKTSNFSTPLELRWKYFDLTDSNGNSNHYNGLNALENEYFHWDNSYSSVLRNSSEYPGRKRGFVRIFSGFHICKVLNNASFFTDVNVRIPSGKVQLKLNLGDVLPTNNPSTYELEKMEQSRISEFVNFIEEYARNAQNSLPPWIPRQLNIVDHYHDVLIEGLCLSIAQGTRFNPSIAEQRVLRTLDPSKAFPFLNFNGQLNHIWKKELASKAMKSKYSIVYFIETHSGYDSMVKTINALNSTDTFFYVHVDRTNWYLHHQLRHEYLYTPNIYFAHSFKTKATHSSNLWSHIRALNDLSTMIDYDWIINLSDGDYPLHSPEDVKSHLQSQPTHSWIKFDESKSDLVQDAYSHVRLCAQDEDCSEIKTLADSIPDLQFGLEDIFPNWTMCCNQGLILSKSFVEHFRRSPAASLLLATFHTVATSEGLFWSAFAANASPLPLVEDDKRLACVNHESLKWKMWNSTDVGSILHNSKWAMFINHLDIEKDSSFADSLDRMRSGFSLNQLVRPNNTRDTQMCNQFV
eukprot:TRINITY_DN5126_c0_g1_i1.p1 TRINITY_DN5126_c0_g1~~TRINITY_DN5126_c0_g1_i1.p1  ORF type:complete len:589 (+),score=147.95 TRINITY_DN5126_c0_g1_i1:221-1987(+)